VALVVSPRAGQPCALIWWRPTIVLPQSLADGDERQLRFALAHEWSHVARGDVWTWSLSSVVRWFYFYQPLLWHLRRQLRVCQDYLADAAGAQGATEDYAEFLTSYSSQLKHPNAAAGLGIAGRASELHRRVIMLLDPHRPLERAAPRRWNFVVVPLAVLILAAVACVRTELPDKRTSGSEGSDAKTVATKRRQDSPPFSGRIRPGDILRVDLAGGFPEGPQEPTPTVEPDGNLALGAQYGRFQIAGMTLQEAEAAIIDKLEDFLKDPRVQLTYVGHDPDVVPAADVPLPNRTELVPPDPTPPTAGTSVSPYLSLQPAAENRDQEKEPLQPLDTVQILLPLSPKVHYEVLHGKTVEVYNGSMPDFNGVYVIEPGGDISLPHGYGRVNVKGLDVRQAGKAIRDRLTEKMLTRTALPAVHVVKRGRAVFPEGREPPADYRIRKGDSLLIGTGPHDDTFNFEVDAKGDLPPHNMLVVHVEGMTLAEAQEAVVKGWTSPVTGLPYFLTLGGWREQADPDVIDQLEGGDATRVRRIERELLELKNMIQQLQLKR
jgi:protein involved in polysaccharide export with SLBB domain